jgi:hypothetical protein
MNSYPEYGSKKFRVETWMNGFHPDGNIFLRMRRLPLTSIMFFACFYLYVWLFIEPELIYHGFGVFGRYPIFLTGWSFFRDFLGYPGGLIEYISAFFSQLYYYSWLGALIITLVAAGLYLSMKKLIILAGEEKLSFISYIPAIALLITYNRYYHLLSAALALLVSLLFWIVYAKMSLRTTFVRLAIFLIEFAGLYYIAGPASLLFAGLAAAYEIFICRRLILGGLYLAAAFIVAGFVGYYIFKLEIADAYLSPTFSHQLMIATKLQNNERNMTVCLYFFPPVVFLFMVTWSALVQKEIFSYKFQLDINRRLIQGLKIAGLVVAISVVFFSFNYQKKNLLWMNYLYQHQKWPQMLELAEKLPPESISFCKFDINLAMYHTGRFGDDMFTFSQNPKSLLFLPKDFNLKWARLSEFFLDLGHINEAERLAYEYLENMNSSPFILKQLAIINLVKGQTQTARVFLNVLAKDLIYGRQAEELLGRLDTDPQLTSDVKIQHLRSIMLTGDFVFSQDSGGEAVLLKLLEKNRCNKMAFEYLMANYLLANVLDKIVGNIWRLDDFDYQKVPRLYEEAILIYSDMSGKKVDLHGRKIDERTIERTGEFSNALNRFLPDVETAFNALKKDFGNSYLFYNVFDVAGQSNEK